jgi:hypothetical protein
MLKITLSALAAALLALGSLIPSPAEAQARVFVAAQGSDGNPCTFAAPCRTFQHAHNVVAAGGEIDVLDPAGYGAVFITKAMSIQGHGFAGISVGSGGTGITISAGANDAVNLTGLLIDGAGVGLHGIWFYGGKSLTIENCFVRNITNTGIFFDPPGAGSLAVSNTVVADAFNGVLVKPEGAGTVTAALNRVAAYNQSDVGIFVDGTVATGGSTTAVATDSVASGNNYGFVVYSGTAPATLTMVRSVSANNTAGIYAKGSVATLRLTGSTVTDNPTVGWHIANGAKIKTFGDNNFDGNGTDVGALTPIGKQ